MQALAEDRDHSRLAVRALPRAVDVCKAQHDVGEPVQHSPRAHVGLRRELRGAVRGERFCPGALGARPRRVLAVEGAARRGEDHGRTRIARGLEDIEGADDIHRQVMAGILHRGGDARLRCEVADRARLEVRERSSERRRVDDVELLEACLPRHVRLGAGGEVVDDEHLVAAREEHVGHVRPDESRATGDEHTARGRAGGVLACHGHKLSRANTHAARSHALRTQVESARGATVDGGIVRTDHRGCRVHRFESGARARSATPRLGDNRVRQSASTRIGAQPRAAARGRGALRSRRRPRA